MPCRSVLQQCCAAHWGSGFSVVPHPKHTHKLCCLPSLVLADDEEINSWTLAPQSPAPCWLYLLAFLPMASHCRNIFCVGENPLGLSDSTFHLQSIQFAETSGGRCWCCQVKKQSPAGLWGLCERKESWILYLIGSWCLYLGPALSCCGFLSAGGVLGFLVIKLCHSHGKCFDVE